MKIITPLEKILQDLDEVLANLDNPNYDIKKLGDTVNRACKLLASIIDNKIKEKEELKADLEDLKEITDALIEQNEILQTDILIILEFLKKSGIDISYIVTKSETTPTPKNKKKK